IIESDNAPKTAYYGYEKDDLKCVIRIDELTDPFGNFVCGTVDIAQEDRQLEFSSLFKNTKASEDSGEQITSFRVSKIESGYALGSANGNYFGYTWMAKKENEDWKIVWRGTEIATCSDMEKYDI